MLGPYDIKPPASADCRMPNSAGNLVLRRKLPADRFAFKRNIGPLGAKRPSALSAKTVARALPICSAELCFS